MHRFYLPSPGFLETNPSLSEDESRHCSRVLRLDVGQRITVFDGEGNEASATIRKSGDKVEVSIEQRNRAAPLSCSLTLAQAVPKGKNMDLIVQKAVELGATRIVPLLSDRTVVKISEEDLERKREKWQAVALEACKQCGQNRLVEISVPIETSLFLKEHSGSALALIASLQPDSRRIKDTLAEYQQDRGRSPEELIIMIGPEGDFTPAETALAKSSGFVPVTLGPIILRTETAAIYCLSVLGHELF